MTNSVFLEHNLATDHPGDGDAHAGLSHAPPLHAAHQAPHLVHGDEGVLQPGLAPDGVDEVPGELHQPEDADALNTHHTPDRKDTYYTRCTTQETPDAPDSTPTSPKVR